MLNAINQYFTELGTIGLALNSCIESFFLVPPPDLLLIAMDLKSPQSALYFAFICTIASAIGGAIGYFIGRFGGRPVFNWLFGLISKNGNRKAADHLAAACYGQAAVGRGMRFFIVSTVLMIFGEKIKDHIEFVIVGATVVIIAFFYILYKKRNALPKIENNRTIIENTMVNLAETKSADTETVAK